MSKHIQVSGPFIKQFYANTVGAGTRAAGNPALPSTYDQLVPSPVRRVYLFIQNKGTTEIDLTLAATGATLKLYAFQSISLDNYNGGFSLSSYTNAAIIEAFA